MRTTSRLAGLLSWLIGASAAGTEARLQLPLAFEENVGQADPEVLYLARARDGFAAITATDLVLARGGDRLPLRFVDATTTRARPFGRLRGTSSYFVGSDPACWHQRIGTWQGVAIEGAWPGIDVEIHGNERSIELDFLVAPGADPDDIGWTSDGSLEIEPDGSLVVRRDDTTLVHRAPIAFQQGPSGCEAVAVRYVLDSGVVRFVVGPHDPSRELVIDPVLAFSTQVGGSGWDIGRSIRIDDLGFAYLAGETASLDFPVRDAARPDYYGSRDGFVMKIDAAVPEVVWATYLGGRGEDSAVLDLDGASNVHVAGHTTSRDFPTLAPIRATLSGWSDAYAALLSNDGALLRLTYLGGSRDERVSSIVASDAGDTVIGGLTTSTDLATANPVQAAYAGGWSDGFALLLDPAGLLAWSTYFGGIWGDDIRAVGLDPGGLVHVAGYTRSGNIPVSSPFQAAHGGGEDAFVARLDPAAPAIVWSSYLGGSGIEIPGGLVVDDASVTHVAGFTTSPDFPLLDPLQPAFGGDSDAWVAAVLPDGRLVRSSWLGGSGHDTAEGIAVRDGDDVFIVGTTSSPDFPLVDSFQRRRGESDAFLVQLPPSGTALPFATLVGGGGADSGLAVAVAPSGDAWVTGGTDADDFPEIDAIPGARPPENGGNAFVTRIGFGCQGLTARLSAPSACDLPVAALDASASSVLACSAPLQFRFTGPDGTVALDWSDVSSLDASDRGRWIVDVRCPDDPGCESRAAAEVFLESSTLFTAAAAVDVSPCGPGIEITWEPATFRGPTGQGHYNLYRSDVDCDDAMSRGPFESGLLGTSWLDLASAGETLHHVVEAEDRTAARECTPVGFLVGGAATRICLPAVTDIVPSGPPPAPPCFVLRVGHVGDVVTVSWAGVRPLLPGEHFQLFASDLVPVLIRFPVNEGGDVSLSHVETPTADLRFYDLRIADACESVSADDEPPGRGPISCP